MQLRVDVALARRRRVPVPPVHVREAELVDQRRAEDAGDANQLLIDVVVVRDEVRRRHRRAERSAVGVAVVRIAPEQRVLVADAEVRPVRSPDCRSYGARRQRAERLRPTAGPAARRTRPAGRSARSWRRSATLSFLIGPPRTKPALLARELRDRRSACCAPGSG